MDIQKMIEQKINAHKNLLKSLRGDKNYSMLIEDRFDCGRAMATENTINELEEILIVLRTAHESEK